MMKIRMKPTEGRARLLVVPAWPRPQVVTMEKAIRLERAAASASRRLARRRSALFTQRETSGSSDRLEDLWHYLDCGRGAGKGRWRCRLPCGTGRAGASC